MSCTTKIISSWSQLQKASPQQKYNTTILTKRLELLFRTVFAFPKASSRGLDSSMISFTCWWNNDTLQNYNLSQTGNGNMIINYPQNFLNSSCKSPSLSPLPLLLPPSNELPSEVWGGATAANAFLRYLSQGNAYGYIFLQYFFMQKKLTRVWLLRFHCILILSMVSHQSWNFSFNHRF